MSEKQWKRRLWITLRFLRGSKRYFILSACCGMLASLLDLVSPRLVGFAIDILSGGEMAAGTGAERSAALLQRIEAYAGGNERASYSTLLLLAVLVVSVALGAALFRYLFRILNAVGAEQLVERMRNQLFAHIESVRYSWYTENPAGDIMQRCTSDVETVKAFLSEQLTSVIRIVVLMVLALGFMSTLHLWLTLIALLFVPLIVLYSFLFHRRIERAFLSADEEEGRLSTMVQENLSGVRVVRAFGREQYERERFEAQNHRYTATYMKFSVLISLFWSVGDFFANLQVMIIVVCGVMFAVRGQLSAGDYIAFIAYNTMLVWPVRSLGRVISDMSKAGVSLDRIRYIMEAETEPMEALPVWEPVRNAVETEPELTLSVQESVRNAVETEPEPALPVRKPMAALSAREEALRFPERWDIEFSHVSFSYPGQETPVLSDVSFYIPEGSTFGLLGETGSGKSTLLYLLLRLYELPEGCGVIRIGGRDIRTLPLAWLRRRIGMVLQEPYLFSRTLGENIQLASAAADMEVCSGMTSADAAADEAVSGSAPDAAAGAVADASSNIGLREAIRMAGLEETIEHFQAGLDTLVGERGVTLSGGQKQRVAIAQMLTCNTPVMVLDDALSAVDAETDAKIRASLRGLRTQRPTHSSAQSLTQSSAQRPKHSSAQRPKQSFAQSPTLLLVSHRVSTLMETEQILVLHRGRVAELGSHEELMRRNGLYRRIADIQNSGQEDIQA